MFTKLQKRINKHKKMIYGLIGGLILLILVGGYFLGASANKDATIVNESKTKNVSKDTSASSQEKTSQSTETEKASPTSTSASSSTSTTEDKQTSEPVYEPSHSEPTSSDSYYEAPSYEPASSSSNYSEPVYEEPASSTYTPASSSSNSYKEITRDDIKKANKAVDEWNKANGFGGDHIDSKGNGYMGW